MSTLTPKTVSFQFNPQRESKFVGELLKKDSISQLENTVLQLLSELQGLVTEQEYMKMRETSHRNSIFSSH